MNKYLIIALCFIATSTSYAQLRTLKGKVVFSSDNEPIIGATVMLKGTTTGTITDVNGEFSINIRSNSTVVFSYVGLKIKEVIITDFEYLKVELTPSNKKNEWKKIYTQKTKKNELNNQNTKVGSATTDNPINSSYSTNLQQLIDYKQQQKKIREEQIQKEKLEYETNRANKNIEIQNQYKIDIANAKERVKANPKWTFYEYSNAYYIGEMKNGKREGYGELYFKNTAMIEEIFTRTVSKIGYWKNDALNGNGTFCFSKRIYNTSIFGFVIEDYWKDYICKCNFVNDQQDGEGTLSSKDSFERILYSNGKIIRNYSQEEKDRRSEENHQRYQADRQEANSPDCYTISELKQGYTDVFGTKYPDYYEVTCTKNKNVKKIEYNPTYNEPYVTGLTHSYSTLKEAIKQALYNTDCNCEVK